MSDEIANEISNQDMYDQIVLTRQEQVMLKDSLAQLRKNHDRLRTTIAHMRTELSEVHSLRGKINFIFYVVLIQVILTVLSFIGPDLLRAFRN